MKILVAEDERELSKPLVTVLEHKGYSADAAYDGQEAYDKICKYNYDIILLDIMMPKLNGLEVLQKIRAENIHTPVILLTAKSESEDKITGLDTGADDYLTKPFVMGELLARIRALTRRSDTFSPEKMEYGMAALIKNTEELSGSNTSFRLNNKEYALAEIFFSSPEKELEAAQLMERVWSEEKISDVNLLNMYVNYVKNKLSAIDQRITIRNTGECYIMELTEAE